MKANDIHADGSMALRTPSSGGNFLRKLSD
jgi:hypothetical protein